MTTPRVKRVGDNEYNHKIIAPGRWKETHLFFYFYVFRMMEISTQFCHFNPDVQYPNYLNSDPQYASQELDVTD